MNPLLPTITTTKKTEKCIVTSGSFPNHIDPTQPPLKRKPFSSLWAMKWCHHIDILLPRELAELVVAQLASTSSHYLSLQLLQPPSDGNNVGFTYHKVMMKLEDILTGDFFNVYVKAGDICMRSEGRRHVDDLMWFNDGILTLQLSARTYQRTGLVGKPIDDGGRKHQKSRYQVDINLRLPSMVHGKKGFERVVWAARNVLNQSKVWLFSEIHAFNKPSNAHVVRNESMPIDGGVHKKQEPIEKFHPRRGLAIPYKSGMSNVTIPPFLRENELARLDPETESDMNVMGAIEMDECEEMLEYLSLVAMDSPRIRPGDKVDPYICRYQVPGYSSVNDTQNEPQIGNVDRLHWEGFLTCKTFVLPLLISVHKALKKASQKTKSSVGDINDTKDQIISTQRIMPAWVSIFLHGLDGEHVTLLMRSNPPKEGFNTESDVPIQRASSVEEKENLEAETKQLPGDETEKTDETESRKILRADNELKETDDIEAKVDERPKEVRISFIEWNYQS